MKFDPDELFPDAPPDALTALREAWTVLDGVNACGKLLNFRAESYRKGEPFSFYESCDRYAEAAEGYVHRYTAEFIFYAAFLPLLKEKYKAMGAPDCCYDGAREDLLSKLRECRAVYGINGSFVSSWFAGFFDLSLFTFGRLEFRLTSCPCDFEKDGKRIKKGQPCIDVHIPSKGHLTREDLDASYAQAAAFFAPELNGAPVVFHCHSWMLADYHPEMLDRNSGIMTFYNDYTVVKNTGDDGDLWRIFGGAAFGDCDLLPEKTALQRAYKARLKAGLPVYGGVGLFFYEK